MAWRGKWAWISLGLACWAIAASAIAGYYFVRCSELEEAYERALAYVSVSLCIDYGNGTVEWHNDTLMPVGSTLFNLTEQVTWNFSYVVWPGMGAYVTCINGLCERIITPGHEGYSWIWYYWDADKKAWVWGPVACDKHVLYNGEVLMWRYEHWSF